MFALLAMVKRTCVREQCSVSGKFAFSEFRSVEETNLAMNLKGAMFQGSVLDVKRPAKYQGPITEVYRTQS